MVLCYFLNYCPTNKLELALRRQQQMSRRELRARESARPRAVRSTLFLAPDDYVTDTMFLSFDPEARVATVAYRGRSFVYKVDSETDKRMLVPLLLLSK